MKVYIGKYASGWVGPYQLADLLRYVGVSEDRCYEIGHKLSKVKWLKNSLEWIHSKRPGRTVKVKIHHYDTWNMDTTLAVIILPMLKQLKETKHGYGYVKDEDVPEHLKSINAEPLTEEQKRWGYTDNNAEARFEWIFDEMIWAFTQLTDDNSEDEFWDHGDRNDDDEIEVAISKIKCDHEGLKKHEARISNGLRLFGVYYQNLWD